jgi:type I restriction enzyme S subunit
MRVPPAWGRRTVLLRPDPEVVDGRFLLYTLLAPQTQSSLLTLAEGSTVPHLNVDAIRRFHILAPDLKQQRTIASVLGAIDDKIDSNRRFAGLLEEMATTLFRARFVDFVGVEEFEESEVGRIPRGWSVRRIDELAGINAASHSVRRHPERIRYIDISSVGPHEIREVKSIAFADAPSRARRILRSGDTIVSRSGPNDGQWPLFTRQVLG